MKRPVAVESASSSIDEKVKELGDWRGKTLAKVRETLQEPDPEIVGAPGSSPALLHRRSRLYLLP